MFAGLSFFLYWFIVLFVIGAILYLLDVRFGTRVCRWFYDMTHEHPRPSGEARGFIFHRKAQTRFTIAVIVAVGQSAFAVACEASTLPQELLSIIFEVPCLMCGFYFGPELARFWGK